MNPTKYMVEPFILVLTFFAIVPDLGFFDSVAFVLLSFILVLIFYLLYKKNNGKNILTEQVITSTCLTLLFYAAINYGGLYQNELSIIIGKLVMIVTIGLVTLYILTHTISDKIIINTIILTYVFLAFWTIVTSPHPQCDCFVQIKEAPLKLIQGKNPYSSTFSQVYDNVAFDYFNYLPFSFLYALPFVLIFGDPRVGTIAASLITVYIFFKLFGKNNKKILYLFIATYLFLPRSFYMLEHMYQDKIIFTFYMLFIYFVSQKKLLAYTFLSLFFSMKQHLFVLVPLFFRHNIYTMRFFRSKAFLYGAVPFLPILFFLMIDPNSFLHDTLFFFNPATQPAPINTSLSLPTVIKYLTNFHHINLIHTICFFVFIVIYAFLLRTKKSLTFQIFMIMFIYDYFMYNSFFNHYFFITQFLLFYLMEKFYNLKIAFNTEKIAS